MDGLIGNTPLVELKKISLHAVGEGRVPVRIWAKVEKFNVGGSVKDRVALSMVNDAEERGALLPGGTILEATSGNTGIGLALVGARRGYHVTLVMPRSVSVERRKLLKAYGAELILVDGSTAAAVKKAQEIHTDHPEYFYASQLSRSRDSMLIALFQEWALAAP
ncbi:cysteine synthase A [Pelomyxa schiedti]|nr:cysteine synthase A [Pelomyxa schiedti]